MEQRDPKLWKIALKRARFRKNAYSYLVLNLFFWAIWWFTIGREEGLTGWPWPVWVMLGWGVALAFQYHDAYHGDKEELVDKEYEKLIKKDQL